MCIQWTRVLYSGVITRQSKPPISQFNSLCNEFTSFWSMFVYNTLCTVYWSIISQCIYLLVYNQSGYLLTGLQSVRVSTYWSIISQGIYLLVYNQSAYLLTGLQSVRVSTYWSIIRTKYDCVYIG